MAAAKPELLLENHHQALKIRIIFWVLVVVALFAFWGGWAIYQTYGLSQADGGVLRPLWERLALGGFVAGLAVMCVGAMWIYVSIYALHISRIGDQLRLVTMTPMGGFDRNIPLEDVGKSAYYHGRLNPMTVRGGAIKVNAPWITLRIRGRRLPVIIDLQAEFIEVDKLSELAEGAVGEWLDDQA